MSAPRVYPDRGVPAPHDQVSLPVAGDGAICHLRGVLFDAQHAGMLPRPPGCRVAPAGASIGAGVLGVLLDLSAGQHVAGTYRSSHAIRASKGSSGYSLLSREAFCCSTSAASAARGCRPGRRVRHELPRPAGPASRNVLASYGPVGAPGSCTRRNSRAICWGINRDAEQSLADRSLPPRRG